MNRSIAIASILISLIGGTALGWFLHPSATAAVAASESAVEKKQHKGKHRVDDVGSETALHALRNRVKELERQLADAQRPVPPPENEAGSSNTEQRVRMPWNMADGRNHLEELRKNDPERYAMITNGIAMHHANRLRDATNKLDILASVDTSHMTAKELAVHEQLQEIIAREEELNAIARFDNPDATDEMRQEAWKELHELRRQKFDLERQERNNLLKQTALSFGVRGKNATELVDTIKAVYQATQSGGFRHGGPRGPRPPR